MPHSFRRLIASCSCSRGVSDGGSRGMRLRGCNLGSAEKKWLKPAVSVCPTSIPMTVTLADMKHGFEHLQHDSMHAYDGVAFAKPCDTFFNEANIRAFSALPCSAKFAPPPAACKWSEQLNAFECSGKPLPHHFEIQCNPFPAITAEFLRSQNPKPFDSSPCASPFESGKSSVVQLQRLLHGRQSPLAIGGIDCVQHFQNPAVEWAAPPQADYTDHLTRRRIAWPLQANGRAFTCYEVSDDVMLDCEFIALARMFSMWLFLRCRAPAVLTRKMYAAPEGADGAHLFRSGECVDVTAAARVRVRSSEVAYLAICLATTSEFFQHVRHPKSWAEAIISRVYGGYCKRVQVRHRISCMMGRE